MVVFAVVAVLTVAVIFAVFVPCRWTGLHRWDSPGGHCEVCHRCDEFFGPHDHCHDGGR